MSDHIIEAPETGRAYMPDSSSMTHLTPPRITDPLHHFCSLVPGHDARPDLDPCAADGDIVNARTRYLLSRGQDGLVLPWDFEVIFVNPPYDTDPLAEFTNRCRIHRKHGVAIGLLPAQKTEKLAWQRDVLPVAAKVCWVDGRLTFLGARNQAPFPSAVACWAERGVYVDAFVKAFELVGVIR